MTLHCRIDIAVGGYTETPLLNGLDKIRTSFTHPDFTDLFVFLAVYFLLRYVAQRESKPDGPTLILSLILSITLVFALSFRQFNSAVFLLGNTYQHLLSCLCIIGFCSPLYAAIRLLYYYFAHTPLSEPGTSFFTRHFRLIGFCVIFAGWLPWILLNYPGSGCLDSMQQLSQFLGDAAWDTHHPPLSTWIMGTLFTAGRALIDANFGFFLYCMLQTCIGAWIYSLSMHKLYRLGVPVRWCMAGILYFAFTPFWGTYAQWVEKDLLFTEFFVLQTICMLDIMKNRQISKKDVLFVTLSSLAVSLLRHNGIYSVAPALLLLIIWSKGISRRRAAVTFIVTLALYEGIVDGLLPAVGMEKPSIVDALSIPFQQTARYVCEHADEVTDAERAVLDEAFVDYDIFFGYDPLIADPIKNYCTGINLNGYLKTWFAMFWKHPTTYMAATFNMGYGYLAPVTENIEAWIQGVNFDYMTELGLHHTFDIKYNHYLVYIWNNSMNLPLIHYLAAPGLYTWISVILAWLLLRQRRCSALILFIPSAVNILVCLASPLAATMRYALPTVAVTPLLIGWTWYALQAARK